MEVLTKQKILVIQTAFLGDAILTLPMIQKLKEFIPGAYIAALCIPSTREVFENSPCVEEVIVYDKKGKQKSWLSFFNLADRLRKEKFSRIYSPHRSPRSSLLAFLSRAEKTIGFDNAGMSFLYNVRRKYDKNMHEVARNLQLIGDYSQNDKWRIFPAVNVSEEQKRKIQIILREINRDKLIAVAPGSVWNTKVYPKEYFVQVIKYLVEKDFRILLIGGKEDALLCSEIESNFGHNVESLAGKLSIVESIELLKNVRMLISNDSAPTHMAMSAGIPALTIYCSTVASFGFYPYNTKSKIISFDDLDCKPCGIHGRMECPIKIFDCALKLSPALIIDKVEEILAS